MDLKYNTKKKLISQVFISRLYYFVYFDKHLYSVIGLKI